MFQDMFTSRVNSRYGEVKIVFMLMAIAVTVVDRPEESNMALPVPVSSKTGKRDSFGVKRCGGFVLI